MNNDYILKLAAEFPFFLREFWAAMDLDKYGRIGWFEEDIAEFVQNGPERRGVLAYRSSGKTHFITTAYSCWRLYRDPDWKISIFSKSAGFAGRITGYVRDALGICPFLQHLKPRKDQKDTAIEFMVNGASASKQPSIRGIGIGSQTAGNRANTIIGDDIEDATNSMTVDARDRLFNAAIGLNAQLFKVNEEIPLEHPSNQRDMIFVGYIEHETDSVYKRLRNAGFDIRSWPLVYPSSDDRKFIISLAPTLAEKLAKDPGLIGMPCPPRVSMETVIKHQGLGKLYFDRNFKLLCRDTDSSLYPLRLGDFMVLNVDPFRAPVHVLYGQNDHNGSTALDIPVVTLDGGRLHRPAHVGPEIAPYQGTRGFVDPAGKGADETGVASVGMLAGLFWIKGCTGFPGGNSNDALDQIALFFRRTNTTYIQYETNIDIFDAFGPALNIALHRHFLKPGQDPLFPEGWKATLEPVHNTGQKESRIIRVIEPLLSTHRLIIDPRSITLDQDSSPVYQLQHQLARLTHERECLVHNDRIDALSGALAQWTAESRTSPEHGAALALKRLNRDDEIYRQYLKTRRKPAGPSWLTERYDPKYQN